MSTYNAPASHSFAGIKVKIEKGVPITPTYHSTWSGANLPWEELGIGDSFLIPCPDDDMRLVTAARSMVSTARLRFPDLKLVSRRVEGGVRIWRVKNVG